MVLFSIFFDSFLNIDPKHPRKPKQTLKNLNIQKNQKSIPLY